MTAAGPERNFRPMNVDPPKDLDKAKLAELAAFYRKLLLRDVMPFWDQRTRDDECGGYLTCFDRAGNVTDADKYIWFQARQCWMYSALHNEVDARGEWLALAARGRDFIVAKAYAGDGRWNYHLDRQGNVKEGTISIFTDLFVLSALCEHAVATGNDEDLPLIEETFDAVERNVHDPEFKDIHHEVWSPRFKRHCVFLIPIHVAALAERLLGRDRVRPLIDYCLEQVLYVFAKDEHEILFESVGRDGSFVDDDEGRTVNCGHILESMWFCAEEGLTRGDQAIVDRAVTIMDWAYRRGYDREHGGLVSIVDSSGKEPRLTLWHKLNGVAWNGKVWWTHCETLYALALAAVVADSREWFDRFLDMHEWCEKNFHDGEYGEWYWLLHPDGRAKGADKGTPWKCAYHLPRALMKIMQLMESVA